MRYSGFSGVLLILACAPTGPVDGDATETSGSADGSSSGGGAVTTGDEPGPDTTGIGGDDTETTGVSTTEPGTSTTGDETAAPPAGPCPAGNGGGLTQAEIDALAGCEVIPGDLIVGGSVTSLAPLAALREVGGSVRIGWFHEEAAPVLPLASLAGLEGLEKIGGSLQIAWLPQLTSLAPLAGLTAVPAYLQLRVLPQVDSLAGLDNITTVGETLTLHAMPALADLGGLASLTRAKGLSIFDIGVVDFQDLAALAELGEPAESSAPLWIGQNAQLTHLAGLEGVIWQGAFSVELSDNPALVDVSALAGLAAVSTLKVSGNAALADLVGFEAVTEATGTVTLMNNPALADLGGLANVQTAHGLVIGGQQAFTDLAALASLASSDGVEVADSNLVELGPLPALQAVRGLRIHDNPALVSLSGLAGVTSLWQLRMYHNDALTGLAGLSAVAQVETSVIVRENASLASLAGMAALTSVGERLTVVDNPALPQADALAWGAGIAAGEGQKIAANKDPGPPANPCPWTDDGECDEVTDGIGACVDGSDSDCP